MLIHIGGKLSGLMGVFYELSCSVHPFIPKVNTTNTETTVFVPMLMLMLMLSCAYADAPVSTRALSPLNLSLLVSRLCFQLCS